MTHVPKLDRREQILMVLANELENNLGSPITTSSLASTIGFSEAALYRHFASKSQMFESLINFAEQSVFSSINNILKQEKDSVIQIQKITYLILTFSERNPGVTRVLIGDVLLGENKKLHARTAHFFERIETQIRQILREANLSDGPRPISNIDAITNQVLSYIEGKLSYFVRSTFIKKPTEHMDIQWEVMKKGFFR